MDRYYLCKNKSKKERFKMQSLKHFRMQLSRWWLRVLVKIQLWQLGSDLNLCLSIQWQKALTMFQKFFFVLATQWPRWDSFYTMYSFKGWCLSIIPLGQCVLPRHLSALTTLVHQKRPPIIDAHNLYTKMLDSLKHVRKILMLELNCILNHDAK